jgi:hypothetical protein
MKKTNPSFTYSEKDGLRLLGISRISRCESCERLAALLAAYRSRQSVKLPLPRVPNDCSYEFCAPLVTRFTRSVPGRKAGRRPEALTRDGTSA